MDGRGIVPQNAKISEGGVARLEPVVGSGCLIPQKESNVMKSSTTNSTPVQCTPVARALEEVSAS